MVDVLVDVLFVLLCKVDIDDVIAGHVFSYSRYLLYVYDIAVVLETQLQFHFQGNVRILVLILDSGCLVYGLDIAVILDMLVQIYFQGFP